jgi:uncharacterized DUF497 family protein
VRIEFDPAKSAKNASERGLPFELVADFNWSKAIVILDRRRDYGEERFTAVGPLDARLHVVCYCISGEARRIISFRKANKREERNYEKARSEAADG